MWDTPFGVGSVPSSTILRDLFARFFFGSSHGSLKVSRIHEDGTWLRATSERHHHHSFCGRNICPKFLFRPFSVSLAPLLRLAIRFRSISTSSMSGPPTSGPSISVPLI